MALRCWPLIDTYASLCLASLVGRHFAIGRDEVPADDMRADEGFDKAADLVAPDNLVKTRVNLLVNRDGELLPHTYRLDGAWSRASSCCRRSGGHMGKHP